MSADRPHDVVTALIGRRYKLGLTQADIARSIGVCRVTVARFETDFQHRRSTPTLYILQRYAAAVGARITIEDNT